MNRYLKTLLVSNTLFVFAGNLFVPVYAIFVYQIGGGAVLAGLLYGVHFGSNFLADFLVVRTVDRKLNVENILQANYWIRGFCWLALGFYPSLVVLFLVQIIIGVCEAFGSPAFNSLVSDHLDRQRHIREWGYWEILKNPAIALAAVTSGLVVSRFGFPALFFLMSFLSLSSLVFYVYLKKFWMRGRGLT